MEAEIVAKNSSANTLIREGGWTKESPPTGKPRSRRNDDISFEVEDERLRQDNEYTSIIDNIPDIEDLQEEELVTQIAAPPSASAHQITTYKQLDNDLLKHSQFTFMDGNIDLKLLAKALSAENDIQEEDTVWEWDKLFAELSSDIKETWRIGKGVQASPDSPTPSSPPVPASTVSS